VPSANLVLVNDSSATLAASLTSAHYRGELVVDAELAQFTTWRIGGPAQLLASPTDPADLLLALRWARDKGVAWRVLGNGSNLLVRDDGVRGLVLRPRRALDTLQVDGSNVRAGAGASFPTLANLAASRGLSGLEFGAGIPGTVGGAVVMNAGWHEHELSRVVERVTFADRDGETSEVPASACAFGYRTSAFRGRPGIVLGCLLALTPDEPASVRARLDEYATQRRRGQPTELASCGSVFVKPPGDFAGRLIEQAGLKGERRGGIQVSAKHANFFVNLGGGTASDALALIEYVESEVEARLGVRLVREVEVW